MRGVKLMKTLSFSGANAFAGTGLRVFAAYLCVLVSPMSSLLAEPIVAWREMGSVSFGSREWDPLPMGCFFHGRHFLSLGSSLQVSVDDGRNWKPVAFPLSVVSVVFCGHDVVLAGLLTATFASRDAGETWAPTLGMGPPTGYDPVDPPVITECNGMVFGGGSGVGSVYSSGVLYYLEKDGWRPFSKRKHALIGQLNCYGELLFLGHEDGLELLPLDTKRLGQVTSMRNGLPLQCGEQGGGCTIGNFSPIISTSSSAYLITDSGIFKFRKDQTGWDLLRKAVPSGMVSGYGERALKCGTGFYLLGSKLVHITVHPNDDLEISSEAEPSKLKSHYWSDGRSLFSVDSSGKVFRRSCG